MLYDVLLPWLGGALLPTATSALDPFASWETPQKSNSSAVRCVIEALCYRLCTQVPLQEYILLLTYFQTFIHIHRQAHCPVGSPSHCRASRVLA